MTDIETLNERIAKFCGATNNNLIAHLSQVQTCLGRLNITAEGIREAASTSEQAGQGNELALTSLNREYLHFARQTARDIVNGAFEGLVVLGITMPQAHALAELTNQQILAIARSWPGPVFQVVPAIKLDMKQLHRKVLPHYQSALLAA